MLPTIDLSVIIAEIAVIVTFLFALFFLVRLIMRILFVNITLLFTPWNNVSTFSPDKTFAYPGVYIWREKGRFFWKTVYVGQSVNVRNRYNQHISGKGSPDIYRAYRKHPQKLRFKAINMYKVHYKNLDALEKRLIHRYNTYNEGYNKTSGNGRHYYF